MLELSSGCTLSKVLEKEGVITDFSRNSPYHVRLYSKLHSALHINTIQLLINTHLLHMLVRGCIGEEEKQLFSKVKGFILYKPELATFVHTLKNEFSDLRHLSVKMYSLGYTIPKDYLLLVDVVRLGSYLPFPLNQEETQKQMISLFSYPQSGISGLISLNDSLYEEHSCPYCNNGSLALDLTTIRTINQEQNYLES